MQGGRRDGVGRGELAVSAMKGMVCGERTKLILTTAMELGCEELVMFAHKHAAVIQGFRALGPVLIALCPLLAQAGQSYQVYVSNEKSGDLTVIDGGDNRVVGTIPVGKRPRGIHASPDGRTVYVTLSGTPMEAPPQLDAKGNPIFQKPKDDDDDGAKADKSADAIGVVDVANRKLTRKISAGSDPEEFSLSKDGTKLYVSNEDVKTVSVIDIATGNVEHIIAVGQEPEGVATAPDGKRFYVTCEAGGDVYVIDTAGYTIAGHFKVHVRPRSMDFSPGAGVGFIPSESTGELNVIDTVNLNVLKVIALPPGSRPMDVKVASSGRKVYVSNGRAGTISVLDGLTHELLNTIKVGVRPWGIALSPDGKFLYAANGPSNDISVVDLSANKEVARVKAGSSPWAVVVVPNAH
jgi:YVTN family beta-propeller protein